MAGAEELDADEFLALLPKWAARARYQFVFEHVVLLAEALLGADAVVEAVARWLGSLPPSGWGPPLLAASFSSSSAMRDNLSHPITLAPWVRKDGPRAKLRKTGAALLAASGKKMENRYLETAAIADLPFPPKKKRANCIS